MARLVSFHGVAQRIVTDALNLLRESVGDPPVWPTWRFKDVEWRERTTRAWEVKTEAPEVAVGSIWAELKQLQSFSAGLDELAALNRERSCMQGADAAQPENILSALVIKYVASSRSVDFVQNVFEEVYEGVESYLCASSVQVRVYLFLPGFYGDVPDIVFSPAHRMFRLDHEEARRIWKLEHHVDVGLLDSRTHFSFGPGAYFLESLTEIPKASGYPYDELAAEKTRAIAAIRLVQPGLPMAEYITNEPVGYVPYETRYERLRDETVRSAGGAFSCELDDAKGRLIKAIWPDAYLLSKELQNPRTKLPSYLRIAGSRFVGSSSQRSGEDRLLDLLISLEALLTRENDAVSYRLPLRGATLIGKTPGVRSRMFGVLTAAYGQRSGLAHGRNQLAEMVKVGTAKQAKSAFLLELEGYVWRVLHCFLATWKKGITREEVLRMIDGALLSHDRGELAVCEPEWCV